MICARNLIKEPFCVINADDFYGSNAFMHAANYLEGINPSELKAAMVGFMLKNTLSEHGSVARGICSADNEGNLAAIEEVLEIRRNCDGLLISAGREGLNDDDLVSMNMWAFSPEIFKHAHSCFVRFLEEQRMEAESEFYIPLIVNSLIKEKHLAVKVLKTDTSWFGVTYREDKPEVMNKIGSLIRNQQYPEKLWVSSFSPSDRD